MIRIATIRRSAAATLAGAGLAAFLSTGALAQDWLGPRVVGTGENASVEYPTPSRAAAARAVRSATVVSARIEPNRTTVNRLGPYRAESPGHAGGAGENEA